MQWSGVLKRPQNLVANKRLHYMPTSWLFILLWQNCAWTSLWVLSPPNAHCWLISACNDEVSFSHWKLIPCLLISLIKVTNLFLNHSLNPGKSDVSSNDRSSSFLAPENLWRHPIPSRLLPISDSWGLIILFGYFKTEAIVLTPRASLIATK